MNENCDWPGRFKCLCRESRRYGISICLPAKNDYAAADAGGTGGHKEINRTTLQENDIEQGLKRIVVQNQLKIIKLRNNSPAFGGELEIIDTEQHRLHLQWVGNNCTATLDADLQDYNFNITHRDENGVERLMSYHG